MKVAVDPTSEFVDMPTKPGLHTGETIRYRKKLWSRVLDETTREIKTDAFFVLDTLTEQETTTALIAHLRAHGL